LIKYYVSAAFVNNEYNFYYSLLGVYWRHDINRATLSCAKDDISGCTKTSS